MLSMESMLEVVLSNKSVPSSEFTQTIMSWQQASIQSIKPKVSFTNTTLITPEAPLLNDAFKHLV